MGKRPCSITDCTRDSYARGLCKLHYSRWQRTGSPFTVVKPRGTPEERFWSKVRKSPGCWEWIAGLANGGYGAFNIRRGLTVKAHRFAYELLVGPIPNGLQLDHLCRNRRCVNPAHLEPVTHAVNVARGEGGQHFGRLTHCRYGHPYDEANTIVRARGGRTCRACNQRRMREYRARKKKA